MTPPLESPAAPRWMRRWLIAAGLYNILWGTITILAPNLLFTTIGMNPPSYPALWQCVGMIIGVYGIGYLAAATNPLKHWPIVLVGFLGKVLGPIGFVFTAIKGDLPWIFGTTIFTNDLIWWIPFALILHKSYRTLGGHYSEDATAPPLAQTLASAPTNTGHALSELTHTQPTLVLLLRHAGCIFCSESIATISQQLADQPTPTPPLVVVHPSENNEPVAELLNKNDLTDAHIVSDPNAELYRALHLKRGSFTQLFGPRVALAGIRAFKAGHRIGPLQGDGLRMPGLFLISKDAVLSGKPAPHAGSPPNAPAAMCTPTAP